ncbi:MAG: DUF6941 family protein [Sulfobacillus sp.]
MLLADSAAVSEGKIFMLGGGWSLISVPTPPFAVVIKIEVPWSETNETHTLALELLNDDFTAVTISTAGQEVAVAATGHFEVGRPPGVKKGTSLDLPLVFGFQPLDLQPGRRYVWKLSIDGRDDRTRQLAFSTRPALSTER